MSDYHVVLGVLTTLMGLAGYAVYFRSIFNGTTKPHPFTWFLFGFVDGTVFIAQTMNGGGPGAWVFSIASVLNFVIFFLALKWGEKRIVRIDWVCLVCAGAGIVMWMITNDALYAVAFAAISDALAKVPTIRKSYLHPYEESLSVWIMDVLKYALSIFALLSINMTTALFPVEVVATNAILIGILVFRRRQLAAGAKTR